MGVKNFHTHILNLSLVALSTLLAFGVLEIGLRIFSPGSLINQGIRVYDPKLSYKFKPNLDTYIDNGKGPRRIITNEYGYIGESFPKDKPTGEFRIANLGDSYVEGLQEVDWDKNFVSLLGKELTENGPKYQTYRSLNFGFSGRGQIEELWVYKYLVRDLDPDLTIVWVMLANDIANNYIPDVAPGQLNENSRGGIKNLIKKSALANFIFQHTKHDQSMIAIYRRLGLTNAVVDTQESGMPPVSEIINYSTNPKDSLVQEKAYAITREQFGEFKRSIDNDGGQLLVVLIPPGTTDLDAFEKQFFIDYPKAERGQYDFSKPHREMSALLRDLNIVYLDLWPEFSAYENGISTIANCGTLWGDHFTACGHHVTAEIVGKFIQDQYLGGHAARGTTTISHF